jgi:hypothetical protein
MQETQNWPVSGSAETTWTDYVEAIWRRRRFVAFGILAAWVGIALLAFLMPKQYECQATVGLPGVPVPEPAVGTLPVDASTPLDGGRLGRAPRQSPGITIALYKRLQRALADRAVVEKGLGELADAATVQAVLDSSTFSPVSSGPRNDLARFEAEDRITAVQISYSDRSPQHARQVVSTMASVVREALLTVTVLDQIETDLQARTLLVRTAQARLQALQAQNASLAQEQSEIAQLARESPPATGQTLTIMDATAGGYRYLSPQAQLVGIKSNLAHNRSQAGQIAREVASANLFIAHLRHLDQVFRAEFERRGCQLSSDPAQTIRDSLAAVADADGQPAATYLRAEIASWAETLAALRLGARFSQAPTLRIKSRGLMVLAALAASVLFVLSAALLGESWQRHRAARRLG